MCGLSEGVRRGRRGRIVGVVTVGGGGGSLPLGSQYLSLVQRVKVGPPDQHLLSPQRGKERLFQIGKH